MVDRGRGAIDSDSLDAFLRSAGHEPSEAEVLAIIRRMDADGDATVTPTEWADFWREIPSLSRPEPLPGYLSRSYFAPHVPYYSHLPYTGFFPHAPSLRYHDPYWRAPYHYSHWPSYRPYHSSYLPWSYSAPTYTTYVPRTYSTWAPITPYHTEVIPSYKYVPAGFHVSSPSYFGYGRW